MGYNFANGKWKNVTGVGKRPGKAGLQEKREPDGVGEKMVVRPNRKCGASPGSQKGQAKWATHSRVYR